MANTGQLAVVLRARLGDFYAANFPSKLFSEGCGSRNEGPTGTHYQKMLKSNFRTPNSLN